MWKRSACKELQDCIQDRPKEGESGFSKSFEEFAKPLEIDDPRNETQCEDARYGLVYDKAYLDDTEICKHFQDLQCGAAFSHMDSLSNGTVTNSSISNKAFKPPLKKLPFVPLKDTNLDQISVDMSSLYGLQDAEMAFQNAIDLKDIWDDHVEKLITSSCFALPSFLVAACL